MKALAVGIEDALTKNFVQIGEGERGVDRMEDAVAGRSP